MINRNKVKIRSKAPLRLGIAGGGSDVSPFCDHHGGAVLNATINLYAHTFIESIEGNMVIFKASDISVEEKIDITKKIDINDSLMLHRAVYKRVMEEFNDGVYLPLKVITYCDAPPGSGLGSSSAIVVSMLESYRQLLSLPFGEYDLAKLAFDIERNDCGLAGGKQDQYAATFGGFNFMEFSSNNTVIVNPLRIRRHIINEFESSVILFFTGASRDSAAIINDQVDSLNKGGSSLQAMHEIKHSAYELKASLLKGSITDLAQGIKHSWEAKKATSASISNSMIRNLEVGLLDAGAISFKLSGAGGGGFMMIFVKPEQKFDVERYLNNTDGQIIKFQFTLEGAISWTI